MDIRQRPLRDIYVPLPGPPDVERPSPAVYARMGAANIYRMIEDFYAELAQSAIRGLFPRDMHASARNSGDFFVQFLGGPPVYEQQHGPPRLRMRHIPFRIDQAARQVWLSCFDRILDRAVDAYAFPPEQLETFRNWLHVFSEWMVNTRDTGTSGRSTHDGDGTDGRGPAADG